MKTSTATLTLFAALTLSAATGNNFFRVERSDELPETWSGYVPIGDMTNDPVGYLVEQIKRERQLLGPNETFTIIGTDDHSERFAIDINLVSKDACWKNVHLRGTGRIVHACPDGWEKQLGLCYEPCQPGYTGLGPLCSRGCEDGFTNLGLFCARSPHTVSSNHTACPWYDVCGLTFKKGCSYCPEQNPAYHNSGCLCHIYPSAHGKGSYTRKFKPMSCGDDEEFDGGLCYKKCPSDDYHPVGPVCWRKCKNIHPADFGAACCKSKLDCGMFIFKTTFGTLQAIGGLVHAGLSGGVSTILAVFQIAGAAAGFLLHECDYYDNLNHPNSTVNINV